MPRITRAALIQASNALPDSTDLEAIKAAMIEKHVGLIAQAAERGANVCCLQEIFYGPYFCAEQDPRWYRTAEQVPDGPTVRLIDETGEYLGKYRKHHIPHCQPGFWEKFYFTPGDLGYPVFETKYGKIGVYICYDRHFPEGARELGLNGAEIVFNPSATVAGLSEYLWKLEQPAHAVANQYFVGAINRVGTEAPWNIGEFYGQSYFCDPRGQIVVEGSRDQDEVIIADLDLDLIQTVRDTWQFYRDRRPESYEGIAAW